MLDDPHCWVRTPIPVCLLLFAGCSNTHSATLPQPPLRVTVPPGAASPITFKTHPMAACTVRPAGDDKPGSQVQVFTDPQGNARFFFSPNDSSEDITKLVVRCESAAGVTVQNVELRASRTENSKFPAPLALPPPVGKIRRALSREEAANMSDEEFIKGGYPLPPDERVSPKGYEVWLSAVTRQRVAVNPGILVNRLARHEYGNTQSGLATSNNWSGVELRGASGPFAWVSAWWNVPSVSGESKTQTKSSTWVGIDGDSTTDLAQAGTEQDAFGTGTGTVTSYYAWSELLPNQPTESALTGVAISPGDQVFTEVWLGPAGGSPSLTSSFFMVVCLENLTTSGGACFDYTPVGSTVIGGSEAEWIMERTSTCDSAGSCTPADLANFGTVSTFTTNVLARRSNAGRHQGYIGCCGAGSFLINMTSDGSATGTTLDTTNTNGGTINFQWSAFH